MAKMSSEWTAEAHFIMELQSLYFPQAIALNYKLEELYSFIIKRAPGTTLFVE